MADSKNDQLAKQRAKRATASKAKSTAKAAPRKAVTAKAKTTAKAPAAKKSTAKKSTAKAQTRRGTTGPRTKGARFHIRQIARDAVAQGLIEDYWLRGLGDDDLPVTLIPSKRDKSTRVRVDGPKQALSVLQGLGYKPSDGVADSVAAIGA